jgi:hypothetical protein
MNQHQRIGIVILSWFILVIGDVALHIHPHISPGNKLRGRIYLALPLLITALDLATYWGKQ